MGSRLIALIVFFVLMGNSAFSATQCRLGSVVSVKYQKNGQEKSDERVFDDSSLTLSEASSSYRAYVESVTKGGTAIQWTRNPRVLCSENLSLMLASAARAAANLDFYLQQGSSCAITHPTSNSIMVTCNDGSSGVYYPDQDAVFVNPDTERLYNQMAQQTQAMQALVSQAEFLQRKFGNAAAKAVTVTKDDFNKILQDIQNEAKGGPPLPKIEQIVSNLKSFKMDSLDMAVEKTYQSQKGRLQTFAKINNSSGLTKAQTQWYFEQYVRGQDRISDLQQKNNADSNRQINALIEENLNTLVASGSGGPFAKEKTAASKAILDSFAPDGVVRHPENDLLDEGMQGVAFRTSLSSKDQNEREDAMRVRSAFNRLSNHASYGSQSQSGNASEVMTWVKQADELIVSGSEEDDQDRAYRLLGRAENYLDFEEGNKPKPFNLTETEKGLFQASGDPGTFAGYELNLAIHAIGQAVGPGKDDYLYFHAYFAIREAQKEALLGRLSNFNIFLESAYSALAMAKGTATGLLIFAKDVVTGTYHLVRHPKDSAVALFQALWNYEDTGKKVMELIKAKAKESLTWTPEQAGQFNGQVVGNMINAAYSIEGLSATITRMQLGQKLGSAIEWFDASRIMRGYNKLKSVFQEFVPVNIEYPDLSPAALENFADSSPQFLEELGKRLNNKQMTVGMASHIAMFEKGAARIVMTKYLPQIMSNEFLTSARGLSDDIFVFPKDRITALLKETGNDAALMEKRLGFPPGSLQNQSLTLIEIPMDWSYKPQLPSGFEAAANDYFIWGGYTSGGLPELRMTRVPTAVCKPIDLGIFK